MTKRGCRTKDIYFINIQPMHPTTMLRMVPTHNGIADR